MGNNHTICVVNSADHRPETGARQGNDVAVNNVSMNFMLSKTHELKKRCSTINEVVYTDANRQLSLFQERCLSLLIGKCELFCKGIRGPNTGQHLLLPYGK